LHKFENGLPISAANEMQKQTGIVWPTKPSNYGHLSGAMPGDLHSWLYLINCKHYTSMWGRREKQIGF